MIEATIRRPVPLDPWPHRPRATAGVTHASDARDVGVRAWLISLLPSVLAVMALSLVVAFLMIYFRDALYRLGAWGYLGIMLSEFGNSAAMLVPTPSAAFTLAMGSVLNPFVLGIVGGIAAAFGELLGYYVETRGRMALHQTRMYERVASLAPRWGGRILLAFALLPIPFDVAGIWAGTVRYPIPRFLAFVAAGKIVSVTAVALTGHYGITWLFGPIG